MYNYSIGRNVDTCKFSKMHAQYQTCRLLCSEAKKRGPLYGLKVLDMSRILAGPYCSQLLGDMGAEVIKVEHSTGDGTRTWGPPFVGKESTYFLSVNRNKKSIVVDIKKEAGRKIIMELAAKCDVFLENFLPGKLADAGLGWEHIQAVNPRIVYCSISGFGATGPMAQKPGYDIIVSAMYGMMDITGPEDGEPVKPGVAITDVCTGLTAYGSILAALYERSISGRGQLIETSLMETQLSTLVNIASGYLVGNHEPKKRWGTAHPSIVPYQSFTCKCGNYLVVGIGSDTNFISLCNIIGLPELSTNPNFRKNKNRVQNRKELISILQNVFETKNRGDWIELFGNVDFPFGPIRTIKEAFEDPQAQHRGMVQTVTHPTCGNINLVGFPAKFSRTPPSISRPPPLLGEHTEDIIKNMLGYSDEEYRKLLADMTVVGV